MELWQDIFLKLLRDQKMEIAFPQMPDMEELLTSECYRALQEIRDILKDETLSDKECFEKIENIVCVFEKIGSNGGGRHDFGCFAPNNKPGK